MKIEIEDQAKEWIQAKGNHLTVKILDVHACCAPGVQDTVAVPGKPKLLHPYEEFTLDGVSIYVQNSICQREKISLRLSGMLFLKSISVKIQ